jgi:quercetin dioxygenase-like cupin family protein
MKFNIKFNIDEAEWEEKNGYRTIRVFDISDTSFVQIVEIPAGLNVGRHYHKRQTEVFYILQGSAVLGIGEEEYRANEGDIFLCKPGTVHWVNNVSDKAFRVLVFKYDWVEKDTVWLD